MYAQCRVEWSGTLYLVVGRYFYGGQKAGGMLILTSTYNIWATSQ